MPSERTRLLCIAQSFAPATTPTAIRTSALLRRLAADREIVVLTETPQEESDAYEESGASEEPGASGSIAVEVVRSRRPTRLLSTLRRLRLSKLIDLLVWPDDSIFWVLPALRAARREVRANRPSAIVVFMMPYSAGIVGLLLRRLTGLPLILNLDDSPTCSDMHPSFPSRLHYLLTRRLKDRYARTADAIVYVSATNLEEVRARQPEPVRQRFHLVRYGAETPARDDGHAGAPPGRFEIAYVGAMSGWWALIDDASPSGGAKDLYRRWNELGRYEQTTLDERTSSPAVIGGAILDALAEHPDWEGKVRLTLHGNPYPPDVVERALRAAGVEQVVRALGPVPHAQVAEILRSADLLFITLPRRTDDSRGGRISAKTYEYLATDRPILAAIPRGENWDYLAGKPGVWLLAPDDRRGIEDALVELVGAKLAGRPLGFDRSALRAELSYDTRAGEFTRVIDAAIAHAEEVAR